MKAVFIIFILIVSGNSLFAQPNNTDLSIYQLPGKWVGKLTQDPGGLDRKYSFEIYLEVDESDDGITGYSIIKWDKYYGVIALTGKITDGKLILQESEITSNKLPSGSEWCIKEMVLEFSLSTGRFILSGKWSGITSFSTCSPGEVFVEKLISA